MKIVKYRAIMEVEFEVDDEFEKSAYPNGLNENALQVEMESDNFHEIFQGTLKSYKAEGFVVEKGQTIASFKKDFDE